MSHSRKINSQNNQKIFLFDENREILALNEKPYNKYSYDYIFSDFENPMIISSTLNAFIYPLIEAEKNLIFMTIGQKNLGLTNFLFGSNPNGLLGNDSLFNYVFKAIKQIMSRYKYDKILLEIYKIINDKFIIDFKEIISDNNNTSFIDNLNQHIKNKDKIGNQTQKRVPKDEPKYEEGHIIIKIKYFKFLSNNDLSKSQRQIEIIRSFSFIDIKDDEGDKTNNSYSLICFKKMIQNITNYDLNSFTEISSNLTDILREIFSLPKLYTFIFGLISEYKIDIDKSLKTLNLLNICKNIDNDKFYSYLYQMNISISRLENKALKEEFQVLDLLFGEIIYYLEKTFKKLDQYFIEVKDFELKEKFFYLKQWLIKNNYNFQRNQNFCIVLENTLGYIKNRAQWMQLMKAKTIIMKLTEGLKNNNTNNNISTNTNITNNYKILSNNEIYSVNSRTYNKNDPIKYKISSIDSEEKIFKDLDKEMGNTKSTFNTYNTINNQNINSNRKNTIKNNTNIKKNYTNTNRINSRNNIINKKDKSSSIGLSDLSCFDNKNKKKYDLPSRSIGEFPTGAKSIEASFTQKIFKGLQGNFRKLFSDLYLRFITEEEGCLTCRNNEPISKNYRLNCQKWVTEYKSLSQLQTGIDMDKISMIYNGSSRNNNNISYYNKDEEIKIHFYDDDQSLQNKQKLKERINKINKKMNDIGIKNNNNDYYRNNNNK